ncbi:MAG: hypothetical protein RLZZ447_981 [Verrucomicrobiota bacterium]
MKVLSSRLRDLHLYAGLFLCPFVLLFAISTFQLNHPSRSAVGQPAAKRSATVRLPSGDVGSIPYARDILSQLGVTGEIDYVRHHAKTEKLFVPVTKPGESTRVEVDLKLGTATIEYEERGLAEALNYLHKMPGPHNVRFRGNWTYMSWWAVTADVVVYGILVLTLSGLCLWWNLKAERAVGWVLVGGGAATVVLLVGAIATA